MRKTNSSQEYMGLASKNKELTAYLEMLEEAKKRDHRKLVEEMELLFNSRSRSTFVVTKRRCFERSFRNFPKKLK